MLKQFMILTCLMVNTWTDVKRRSISVPFNLCVALLGLGVAAASSKTSVTAALLGLLPGIGLWVLSLGLPGQIGPGDGIALSACGTLLGAGGALSLLYAALLLAGSLAAVLLCLRRIGRKTALPLMPFFLAGQLIIWLLADV